MFQKLGASQNFEFFQEKNVEGLEIEPLSNSCQVNTPKQNILFVVYCSNSSRHFLYKKKMVMKLQPYKEKEEAVEVDLGASGGPSEIPIQVKWRNKK